MFVGAEGQGAVNQLAWPGRDPPAAVESCNAAADSFIAALASGDTAFVKRTSETPEIAQTVWRWWDERVTAPGGAVRRRTVLGTGPKGPTKLETFTRVETARSEPVVVRLVWRTGTLRMTAIGSGIPLPATTLFLPEGEGRFAAFDPPTDQVVRIGFEGDGAGAVRGLSVLTAAGGRPVQARCER